MWIKGLSHALVSRRFEAEGNLWLVKFMFPSRGKNKQKERGREGDEGKKFLKRLPFILLRRWSLKERARLFFYRRIAEMYKGMFYSD